LELFYEIIFLVFMALFLPGSTCMAVVLPGDLWRKVLAELSVRDAAHLTRANKAIRGYTQGQLNLARKPYELQRSKNYRTLMNNVTGNQMIVDLRATEADKYASLMMYQHTDFTILKSKFPYLMTAPEAIPYTRYPQDTGIYRAVLLKNVWEISRDQIDAIEISENSKNSYWIDIHFRPKSKISIIHYTPSKDELIQLSKLFHLDPNQQNKFYDSKPTSIVTDEDKKRFFEILGSKLIYPSGSYSYGDLQTHILSEPIPHGQIEIQSGAPIVQKRIKHLLNPTLTPETQAAAGSRSGQ
jgi:hypothetical protein